MTIEEINSVLKDNEGEDIHIRIAKHILRNSIYGGYNPSKFFNNLETLKY